MKKLEKYHKIVVLPLIISLLISASGCGNVGRIINVFAHRGEKLQTAGRGVHQISGQLVESEEDGSSVTGQIQDDEEAGGQAQEDLPSIADVARRNYRTKIQGGGDDIVTVMVYLCGSDLESQGGAATQDLLEIMAADIDSHVNVIIETGGAVTWDNDMIDPDANQRWQVSNHELQLLENLEARDMSEGSTLTDFISYSEKTFPADRYMLVLWDHGGGTIDGLVYDERFDNDTMMSVSELDQALNDADVIFDMLGFDCCLMGTAEIAFMAEKYADYMVASQRIEPGLGWYYTLWLDALSDNPSLPTVELGKLIVDSFMEESSYDGYGGSELTLAVTDLTFIHPLFAVISDFFSEAQDSLAEDGTFVQASQIMSGSRAIQDSYDLVDLAYLVKSMDGAGEVLSLLSQCVVYNGTSLKNHSGLGLYIPYTDLSRVEEALELYRQLGIDEAYQEFIAAFANLVLGGRVYNSGGVNPMGSGFSLESLMDASWVDEEVWSELEGFFADYSYDDTELIVEEKGDEYVLSMPEEDWDLITAVEQRVFLDDGEGYIDLGADSMYEFDDDGDLLIGTDYTWVALDGQLVCFYTIEEVFEDDGYWYSYGTVPIYYEGEEAELLLKWDSDNPYGYVEGWRYTGNGSGSQKGLYDLWDGMYFDFLCDYYTYEGEYDDQYFWGGMTVNGAPSVSYEDVGDVDCMVYYELYDIFNNSYWTESVYYSMPEE